MCATVNQSGESMARNRVQGWKESLAVLTAYQEGKLILTRKQKRFLDEIFRGREHMRANNKCLLEALYEVLHRTNVDYEMEYWRKVEPEKMLEKLKKIA